MTTNQIAKECEACGRSFFKRSRDSVAQWQSRLFCSSVCASRSREIVPLHLRFWENVERSGDNRCWNWIGTRDNNGYGKIGVGGAEFGRDLKAHRVSYELRYGPIPAGLNVCHACDNPSCVNPNHLFVGTQKDNAQDMSMKGRINPVSLLNLRPGEKGVHGAGSKSLKEIIACQAQ